MAEKGPTTARRVRTTSLLIEVTTTVESTLTARAWTGGRSTNTARLANPTDVLAVEAGERGALSPPVPAKDDGHLWPD